jgi:hypothetical protein
MWLISDDVATMQKLRGEFSCYCDFLNSQRFDNFFNKFDGKIKLGKYCNEYENLKWSVKYIKIIATLFITASNYLSKKLIMWIITRLNFKNRSDESYFNFVYLITVTAFTSIIVILLLGAKLDFVPYIGMYFKDGRNRDFTWEWY